MPVPLEQFHHPVAGARGNNGTALNTTVKRKLYCLLYPFNIFRFIVFPYLKPVLAVCVLFRLIDSFKAFPLIYVLTDGGPGSVTEVTNYYGFIQAFNFSWWGYGSAIAVVILVGVFVLSWLIGRAGLNNDGKTT